MTTKKGRLNCSCCGKAHAWLGCYGDDRTWWLCPKCFNAADKLSAKEDRWPDERDYRAIKLIRQRSAADAAR
jgi:hypothetical protein